MSGHNVRIHTAKLRHLGNVNGNFLCPTVISSSRWWPAKLPSEQDPNWEFNDIHEYLIRLAHPVSSILWETLARSLPKISTWESRLSIGVLWREAYLI